MIGNWPWIAQAGITVFSLLVFLTAMYVLSSRHGRSLPHRTHALVFATAFALVAAANVVTATATAFDYTPLRDAGGTFVRGVLLFTALYLLARYWRERHP